jgi:glutamine cyclotransferase
MTNSLSHGSVSKTIEGYELRSPASMRKIQKDSVPRETTFRGTLRFEPMRFLIAVTVVAAFGCGTASQADGVPEYGYEIVHVYPHDPAAYTQGLFYWNGALYEGTGLNGRSSIRKVKLETGEVLEKRDVPEQYFGEGIVNWKDRLIQITWQSQTGFVYDLNSFEPRSQFSYPGEGWGLTQDGKRIIMSDGTSDLRFWDPETLRETGRISVSDRGRPVPELNELEWVKGEVYANVYQTDRIARIDPASGKVVGWIDLAGILSPSDRVRQVDVLNGIAYDAGGDRLFVTGKLWPKLFEIRLVKKSSQ